MNGQEAIRNLILALGADVCGFANISRFREDCIIYTILNLKITNRK